MPFGNGARPLTSSIVLPTPGMIVAQEAPLHQYYALANELTESARLWQEAQSQVTPQMANDLATMTVQYPDLPASVLTGAVAGGIPTNHPALGSLNERMGYARTLNPVATAGQSILDVPFDFIRAGVRLATTAFASIYEEAVPRHTRQLVGMSQGMTGLEAREASGDSVGLRAWNTFWNDPIGNLTPAESSPEGQVNLGSGWLPQSNVAESDTAEVQMLMSMGIPEPNAIAQVQQKMGDPLSKLAYEQQQTGITFDSGMSVSPGRLAAKGVGLEEGSMPFHIVSGAADFGSQLVLDPTNLALWGLSKARLANKMLVGNGVRRGVFGTYADDYLRSADYSDMTRTLSDIHINEDVANALDIKHLSDNVEGFSTRRLVADVTNANTPEKVDKALRPYFGSTEGSLPMFQKIPTPKSIMNPSASRDTLGQVLGGKFSGKAGEVGQTFGLKAAVRHNLEGSWMGRMFSEMPGAVVVVDDLDTGYNQVRAYANSMGMNPEESHPFLQAFAELTNGDGTGAQIIVDKMNKWFIENKIPKASDELKRGFLNMWKRWEHNRAYWVGKDGSHQWQPGVDVYGIVDGETIAISKPMAQQVNELYNNTIPLINPREIRNALSDEGLLKIARATSKEIPVSGTPANGLTQTQLGERVLVGLMDSYMQKIWKPFVLLRVAWPVRVVFEEQLRMAASSLDSAFSHPLSWFAYAWSGKMNKTLMGESLEIASKKMRGAKVVYDFTPPGALDEFGKSLAGKGGPFLDRGGKSIGQVHYVNVWQDEAGFAETWLWNLAKNHQDPIQSYLRNNGIDATVEWMMKGTGKKYLNQILETSGPLKKAFLAEGESAARLRWYVEGLHARSVKLTGGDYVYWNAEAKSVILDDYMGGWASSSNRPLTPDEIAKHKLDPHGPSDANPFPGRAKPDGTTGPSPTDGLPESGQPRPPGPRPPGPGPSGTDPLTFGGADLSDLIARREALVAGMRDLADPDEIQKAADQARRLQGQIDEMRASQTAANPAPEVPIQPRVNQFDRPFSEFDPVRVKAQSGKAKDKSYNTMGYHINSNGYDPDRGFATLYNEMVSGRGSQSVYDDLIDPSADFNTDIAVVDDIARHFMGLDGAVDDAALTARFNTWAEAFGIHADEAEDLSWWMVSAINVRHQQQLDIMNYVYPGRLSVRQAATEALTDSKAWGGMKLIGDDLTPDQMAEVRFFYRFIETLTANETDWGRNAAMTVDHVFDNFSDEFVRLNYDSPIVKRILKMYDDQQVGRPKPVSLSEVAPKVIDDLDVERVALGEVPKAPPEGPSIITGYARVDGGPDNVVLYESMASGRGIAAVTIDDYATIDINIALERAIHDLGEQQVRNQIELIAAGATNDLEVQQKVATWIGELVGETRGPNGAYIFQGQVDAANPMLKGVSQELTGIFDDLRGAWFGSLTPTGPEDVLSMAGRRVVIGGYDGVWNPDDQAALVRAFSESGILTDQGSDSLAKVIAVLQRRDSGLTRGWLDHLGREIAGTNRMPARPKTLMALHELETKTTKELTDEMIQLAAGFYAKEIAADDLIRALKPGAGVDAHTGIEARLIELVEELELRSAAAFDRGFDATNAFADDMADAIQRYAQLAETDVDDLYRTLEWVADITDDLDLSYSATRSMWPKHTIDEFDKVSQPHLHGDIKGFEALPDDAEVWVFHGTDQQTARGMLVDGLDPRNKPIDKTEPEALLLSGLDTGTYAASAPTMVGMFSGAAAQAQGYGHDGVVIAFRVRKGDLRPSTESAKWVSYQGADSELYNALDSGTGAVFDIPVPPGNIKMFSTDIDWSKIRNTRDELARQDLGMPPTPERELGFGYLLQQNVDAGLALSDEATAAIGAAERAGYRVEVISTKEQADIWIMDRDRIIRIQQAIDRKRPARDMPNFKTYTEQEAWINDPLNKGISSKDSGIFVREYLPGGGTKVLDDPSVTTVTQAVNRMLGGDIANAPRRGYQFLLEQPYGQPRIKRPYGPHYGDGTQVNLDDLSIMGVAKQKLKATLPDAPKGPEVPPKVPKPLNVEPGKPPLALGEGKQPLALGTGEAVPPGGFASQGGINDELFQGTHYKVIEGPTETGRKMVSDGVIKDPESGEDMNLFASGTVDNYAADMEGVPSRHAALKENLDSAPPVLPGPKGAIGEADVGMLDKTIDQLFYYLMSVPTNKLSRAPAWKQFYLEKIMYLRSYADEATRTKLDLAIKKDLGIGDFEKFRRDPTRASRALSGGETTEGISMTFEQIDQIAKAYALEETKGLLYDMSKKHDASDVLRNIFPFAEAWGEIITAWSKIMWENPRMFRRAQQGVESAREQGWFYNDGNGQEVFAYPGSDFITNKLLGTGEETDVRLTGTTAGVNLALGQYIPGFGPAVQVPASMLLPNMPKFDAVRKFLMPYGDEEVQTPGDIMNLGLPAWFEKALIAIGTGTANYQRLHNNTVMDVFKVLAAEHPEKLNSQASALALMEEASRKASGISWLRAAAATFSPTSPQIEYRVEDTEGTMWQMQTMTSEYYRLLRENNYDQQLALTTFVQRFGFGENLMQGLGVASTFITPKSIQVQERGTTTDAYAWQRNNGDLFEQGAFPYTAAYAMQDVEWDDFDYQAYLDGLKAGTREATTPDEWLMRRNRLVGNIAFDHAKAQVEGRDDKGAKLWLRDARIKLANEYPGFDVDIAGLPARPDTTSQVMEIERWSSDERLATSNAGQGAEVYMALRRRAEAEAYSRGLMPDSWMSVGSMDEWRNWLRQSAEAIMAVYPEFGQLWFDVFRWELTEDETPETLALGGMTF